MNTKFFFLLIVSLLISNTTSSIVASKKEPATVEVKAPTDNVKSGKDQNPNEDIVPANDFHNDSKHAEKTQRHNTDDDGKTHHFHFNRIAAHKGRKMFLLFLSKLILAITHACCFIYCCLHVFH